MSIKISNLPKTTSANSADLLTIVQNGVTKKITKQDLLKSLKEELSGTKADIRRINKTVSRSTVDKTNPVVSKPLSTKPPVRANHATTKSYVDSHLEDVVKVDGRTPIVKPLKYHSSMVDNFEDNDLINKKFVDAEISKTLKKGSTIALRIIRDKNGSFLTLKIPK